jgi:hypothetical protein
MLARTVLVLAGRPVDGGGRAVQQPAGLGSHVAIELAVALDLDRPGSGKGK